jgi:hypothetical protein
MLASMGPRAAATSAIGLGLRTAFAATAGLRDSFTQIRRCAGQSLFWQGAEQKGPRRQRLHRREAFSPQMMQALVGAGMARSDGLRSRLASRSVVCGRRCTDECVLRFFVNKSEKNPSRRPKRVSSNAERSKRHAAA